MMYREILGEKVSLLGFGTMRLPTLSSGGIDIAETRKMVRYAMENGVNYFDTAVPYHDGQSEKVIGDILKDYTRDSFYLATKYPGHIILDEYRPAETFEKQLSDCGVEYFDFYLLHNVFENSIHTYNDPRWGIMEYFIEQKKKGRIRHLGFSSHGGLPILKEFLDRYIEHLEFCQLQINYLDWTLQNAKEKYELMAQYGLPVIVMEPVRGGALCRLPATDQATLKAARPEESIAAWGFRFLQSLPNVGVVLSGMSNFEQMADNVKTFTDKKPLSEAEIQMLFHIAEKMKNSVPCTACRYCTAGCPMGLDIPLMLDVYNELRVMTSVNAAMRLEFLPEDKLPSACIACGTCTAICPQKIDIPTHLKHLTELLKTAPSWRAISIQRQQIMENKK